MDFQEDCLVQCPYYRDERGAIMRCEGVCENNSLHMSFGNRKEMRDYKKQLCRDQWTDCLVAQMLCRKYAYVPM